MAAQQPDIKRTHLIPAGAVHTVRNVGSGNAAELATYAVEEGKPILALVE